MTSAKRGILLILIAFLALACGDFGKEERVRFEEPAKVQVLAYTPGFHSSDIAPGISTSGNFTFSSVTVSAPEKWSIVFKCKHGSFVIERREIFEKLEQGQEVTVISDERWRVYEDGRRDFLGYGFIGVKE